MRQMQEEELELVSGGMEEGEFEVDLGMEGEEWSLGYRPPKKPKLTPP
jgi:hypothetical protein